MGPLPLGCLVGQVLPHGRLVRGAVLGVREEAVPEGREAFEVGVAGLGDDGLHPVRVALGEPQPDRGAVVLDVDREPVQADGVDEVHDD